jgi:hypothetical protein
MLLIYPPLLRPLTVTHLPLLHPRRPVSGARGLRQGDAYWVSNERSAWRVFENEMRMCVSQIYAGCRLAALPC